MSRRKRQERLSVLVGAESRWSAAGDAHIVTSMCGGRGCGVLLLAIGAAATGLVGVLHEFL
jgi:hypothetical protein